MAINFFEIRNKSVQPSAGSIAPAKVLSLEGIELTNVGLGTTGTRKISMGGFTSQFPTDLEIGHIVAIECEGFSGDRIIINLPPYRAETSVPATGITWAFYRRKS